MTEYVQVLIFLVFCVCSESSIRMHRDFSYPVVDEFEVYWNVPTFLCHKHGIHFENYTRKFGITANSGDYFRGNQINILYDPGLFPAMMKNSKGRMLERNGGIPQLGNLTEHLESFKELVEKIVPEDFDGVGVIDFEAWRPIFRQNWNDQTIYKVMSKELERQHHPQWPEKKIELHHFHLQYLGIPCYRPKKLSLYDSQSPWSGDLFKAGHHFEEASKAFMKSTLKLVKLLRPKATWGYYAFPYCYNYRNNKEAHCSEMVEKENNKIQWMFDESTAIYPSIYMSHKLTEVEQQKFVLGRLNEAWRVASRVSTRKIPLVFPYVWYKYYDSSKFLSEGDMFTALETTRKYKMGGAIIWGATENVSSKEKCESLLHYLDTVIGPTVEKVRQNKDLPEEPALGFVIIPFIPHVDSHIINAINHTFHWTTTIAESEKSTIEGQERGTTTARQERSTTTRTTTTTTLSPRLKNYLAWLPRDVEDDDEEQNREEQSGDYFPEV